MSTIHPIHLITPTFEHSLIFYQTLLQKISNYFFLDCWYIWPLVSHDKNQNLIKFQLLLNSYFKWMSGFWCNQLQFWHHNLINIKLLMQCNWCTIIPCKLNLTFLNKQFCNKIYRGRKRLFFLLQTSSCYFSFRVLDLWALWSHSFVINPSVASPWTIQITYVDYTPTTTANGLLHK